MSRIFWKTSTGFVLVALVMAGAPRIPAIDASSAPADTISGTVFPMNILADEAKFVIYLNEEPLVRIDTRWLPAGSLKNDYAVSLAGQSLSVSMSIEVDSLGLWTAISITSSRGDVTVTRDGLVATIKSGSQTRTVELKPGTVLWDNYTPSLVSQAVAAYNGKEGGRQTIPLFIVPSLTMDATLERLDTVERFVGAGPETFTRYRYELPGVDVTAWMDRNGKLCLMDVPAQRAAYVREGYEALRVVPTSDTLLSRAEHEVEVDTNVMIPMRDGVRLATDIYRPAGVERAPVILVRTPYAKAMQELKARFYARRGYVFAVQDCRGRFDSEGTWNPFFDEPRDGHDTIEWLAVQPWSSGKVGMIGGSYLGWVQWWAAREAPPHLVTIIPNVAPPDPWFNIPYEYGSFFLFGAIWWADVLEKQATADISGKALSEIYGRNYAKILRHLPVIDLDKKVLGKKNKYWREWIAHPNNDAYWDRASFLTRLDDAAIPVYHQSGWFDGDGIGSKLNYLAMRRAGHGGQKLVLGPWGHTDAATRTGPNEADFGPHAIVDLEGSYLRWLDRWLKGIENGIDREDPVVLFVMNANRWLTGPDYPLPETKFTKLYLLSSGSANSSKGNGWLAFDAPFPGVAPFDTFVYDPGDPTPDPNFYVSERDLASAERPDSTKVVSTEEERRRMIGYYGMIDETRRDILVYDTEPMLDSLVIAGPVSAVLYASSSAKDTDWFMRLSAVDANGIVFPLVHGTIRARFRESFSKPAPLRPGEIYEYRLDLWQTGVMIPKGHKLRVEVASAAFPTFARNLNTGKHNEKEKKFIPAAQRIYHDGEHPSHVLLPVIENPAFKDAPW
jgi:putative CocE/NonD family hydrolase